MQAKSPKSQSPTHAIALSKAALNLVPIVGGVIASLIDDYVPKSKERAQDQFNEYLSTKLSELDGRLNSDVVDKKNFAELFAKIQEVTSRTNRDLKLRTAANLLANFLLKPDDPAKVSFDELDHLTHCLDGLSSAAITVLGAARKLTKFDSAGGGSTFPFSELPRMLEQDPDLVRSLVAELDTMNLLHTTEGQIQTQDRSHVSVRITHMGARFAERFIEGNI